MNFVADHRSVSDPALVELPERFAERRRFSLYDADTLAAVWELSHSLSPVAFQTLTLTHRRLVGQRFDQKCQSAFSNGSASLVAGALVAGRWPNTAFNRTRHQRSFLHRTFTRARRLTLR